MIYLVEDDLNIGQMESYALKNSGYETRLFENGEDFLRVLAERLPDLVILDIMLPGNWDGLALLRRLKESPRTQGVPVIMVTARTTELDKVKGLDSGADDYIAKPFGIMEFISRVRAVLRRTESQAEDQYEFGAILLSDKSRSVTVGGTPCVLTYKEYELLKLLLKNRGIVLTRDQIMDLVWDGASGMVSRTVDVHIKTLRQKLGDAGDAIKTVRNVGYKIG